ncbi:MAG: hypothetical protein VZR11_11895 [Succinimonas sp.]|nr:hypothetical protein [Succinimonas sp.]
MKYEHYLEPLSLLKKRKLSMLDGDISDDGISGMRWQALSRSEIAFPGLQLLLILVIDCCQGKQEITLQKRKCSQLKSSPLSCHPDAGKWSSEVGSKNAIRALRHKSFLEISRGGERGGMS